MAISVKAYGPNVSGTDVDLSGNPPVANSRLIGFGVTDNRTSTMAGPGTGWTAQPGTTPIANTADDQAMLSWTKDALTAGGETVVSIITGNVSLNGVLSISGDIDLTTVLDVASTSVNNNTAQATGGTISASLTTVTDGCPIVAILGVDTTANVDAGATFASSGAAGATTDGTLRTDQRDGFRNVLSWTAIQTGKGDITVTATVSLPSGNAGLSLILMALKPAVVAGALLGSGATKFAGSGGLTVLAALAGAGQFNGSGVAALTTRAALAGTGVLGAGGAGALTVRAQLAGSGSVVFSGVGSLSNGVVLSGNGGAGFSGQATLSTRAALAGAGTFATAGQGSLAAPVTLSGAGALSVYGQGSLTIRVPLAGSGAFPVSSAAFLSVSYRSPDLLGNFPLWRLKARFAAQEPSGATLTGAGRFAAAGLGALSVRAALAGGGQFVATGLGALTVRAALAGSGQAGFTGAGQINSGPILSGSGSASFGSQASLTARVALGGSGVFGASSAATFGGPGAALAGSGSLAARSNADLSTRVALQAIASAQVSSLAALRVMAALEGSGVMRATGAAVLPSAGGNTPVPEQVFKVVTSSRIYALKTVTRINERTVV